MKTSDQEVADHNWILPIPHRDWGSDFIDDLHKQQDHDCIVMWPPQVHQAQNQNTEVYRK